MRSTSHTEAIVIHSRPYGEGREIVEFLTKDLGKIAGVRRLLKRSGFQRLQPFSIGLVQVSGRSNLLTISSFEQSRRFDLSGDRMISGFYLLELLQKILLERQSEPGIFWAVHRALDELTAFGPIEVILRLFELEFLRELGYGIDFEREGPTGIKILQNKNYEFLPDRGFFESNSSLNPSYEGALIHKASQGMLDLDKVHLRFLRAITRKVIDTLLNGKVLTSRKLIFKGRSGGQN